PMFRRPSTPPLAPSPYPNSPTPGIPNPLLFGGVRDLREGHPPSPFSRSLLFTTSALYEGRTLSHSLPKSATHLLIFQQLAHSLPKTSGCTQFFFTPSAFPEGPFWNAPTSSLPPASRFLLS